MPLSQKGVAVCDGCADAALAAAPCGPGPGAFAGAAGSAGLTAPLGAKARGEVAVGMLATVEGTGAGCACPVAPVGPEGGLFPRPEHAGNKASWGRGGCC